MTLRGEGLVGVHDEMGYQGTHYQEGRASSYSNCSEVSPCNYERHKTPMTYLFPILLPNLQKSLFLLDLNRCIFHYCLVTKFKWDHCVCMQLIIFIDGQKLVGGESFIWSHARK